jgi:hypothetical protein
MQSATSTLSIRSRLLVVNLVALAAAILPSSASALIVASTNTTTAPANDPGWNNHTLSGSLNYVYLGDGWALTARHEGPEPSYPNQSMSFSTGTYTIIPGQNYVLSNPTSYVNSSGQTVLLSLTTQTDLRLVRLNGAPALPSICVSSSACSISNSSPPVNGQLTFVGHGKSRQSTLTTWNSSWQQVSPALDPPNPGPVQYTGYYVDDSNVKRWGTNRVESASSYSGANSLYQILSSTTGVMHLKTPDQVTRDVITLITDYDQSGEPNEAQAYPNDSGSSVFYNRGGNWELAGIVNAVFRYENQPNSLTVFGNATTISDLSYYRSSILDVINAHPYDMLMGDINLDGVVQGNGTGQAASDDVSAFVDGWLYDNGTGAGSYGSWLKGDLSGDGITNISDFFLLRSALNSAGAGGITLGSLVGGAGVPEPSSTLLAIAGAAALVGWRSRRRHRAAD